MKPKWWRGYIQRLEQCGRGDEAAGLMRISIAELRAVLDAHPDLREQALAAKNRFYENRAESILIGISNGHTFKHSCISNGTNEQDVKELFPYSPELEAAYSEHVDQLTNAPNRLDDEPGYEGSDALLVSWSINYSGRITKVRVHKPDCDRVPKSTIRLFRLITLSLSPDRAQEMCAEAASIDKVDIRTGCRACGGFTVRPPGKEPSNIHFTVQYGGPSSRKGRTFSEEDVAIRFARENGAKVYSRVEKLPVPDEEKSADG